MSVPLIRVLPEQLANQIAAGEVVERPASVIKELIENSLDAQATQIDIEVEEGGIKKILVRDNGCGIPRDQLTLAICRHTTSKIESVDDLQAIDSLGFRGEALASIGSVSRLQLTSRIVDAECAWCLSSRNGIDHYLDPAAHPVGTSLEISDLFYNTPARKKFLRTDRTEFRHLDEVFRRMALGRFDVGFQIKHNHRIVHQLHPAEDAESRQRRLHKLFGKAFVQQSSYLEMQASGLRLWGWLSRPEYSRSQADQQYFYVNGRIIRDRIINHAIRQAYLPLLYPGRQAAYVLHLELDESLVDVNVHPTKHEVRFRESRLVHDFIYKVVSDALLQPTQSMDNKVKVSQYPPEPLRQTTPANAFPLSQIRESQDPYGVLTARQPVIQEKTPLGIWLAEVDKKYWLFQQGQGLVLLDLQRAREQVYFQRLKNAALPLQQQPVLVPINITLTRQQVVLLEEYQSLLQDWGIDLRITGPLTIMVLHMPVILRGVDVTNLLSALLTEWQHAPPVDRDKAFRQLSRLAAQCVSDNKKQQSKTVWLEEVMRLPEQLPPVWRVIAVDQLAELIKHG